MRSKKNIVPTYQRVDAVEVFKFNDRQSIERLCPGGFVFDLEIEGNHNYFAEGVLVHNCGAFPKPSKRTKTMKEYVGGKPLVLLSGTLTPESYSQIYHQLWLSDNSPFRGYANFYRWANDYVDKYQKYINGRNMTFYEKARKPLIDKAIGHLIISFSQRQAGFTSLVEEEVIELPMPDDLMKMYQEMDNEMVVVRGSFAVAASNAADRINKLSQICGGTLKVDDDKTIELSRFKADFIRDNFDQDKIAIFYKYQAEKLILEDVFSHCTDVPEEFNSSDIRYFIGQVQSVREGVNLKAADCIVMYNIDFSATSYWQARARLQSKEREDPAKVYWLFCEGGIENYVYSAVQKKRNFTASYYKKHLQSPDYYEDARAIREYSGNNKYVFSFLMLAQSKGINLYSDLKHHEFLRGDKLQKLIKICDEDVRFFSNTLKYGNYYTLMDAVSGDVLAVEKLKDRFSLHKSVSQQNEMFK